MWKIIQRHRAEQELRQHVEALQAAVQALSELNAVARAADAAKGQFLANVSHEIGTPLNAILGYAELLAERVAPPEDRELLDIIRRNGEHLLTLINDLIDLSRIEAGKLQVEKTFCQPATIVAEVVELMRLRAEAKGLTLGIEQRVPFPATIATDPVRLRQILINLVGNAIKFTETGGVRVVLEAGHGPDGPQVRFEVIDSGIGIPAEDVAALFQPFSQVDPSTARRNQGAGLGLAISRRLAELLGGEITLHSEVGKGSSFCLTLHLNMAESDAATAHRRATDALAAAVAEAQLHGTRILLAEDAPDNQRLLKIILERAGAEVTLAEDGLAAVEQAVRARQAGTPFDAVLMDIQMPRVDGFEATRELRAAGFDQPILALTAHATAEDRLRCLEAGCDDYVAKPIDRRALLSTLSRRLKATAKRRRPVATE
jgi:CheY-like chemotaxis protein